MRPSLSAACLRSIRAVTEEGSYAAAARRLGLTHASVSQQIRLFEDRHGTRLFARAKGRLTPTPLCLELADAAERLTEIEAEVARLIARRDPSGQYRLRVGLGNSMPGIAIIGELVRNHPAVSITVETGSHQAILSAVLRREVDLGILPDIPPDPRFRRLRVLQQEVVAITSGGHLLAGKATVTLADLAQEPLIFRSRGSSTQKVVDRAFARAGLNPEPRLIADTRDAVYEAVSLGIGVGFMWRLGTHRTDAVERLVVEGMGNGAEEVVFALSEDRNALTDMFFLAAQNYARLVAP